MIENVNSAVQGKHYPVMGQYPALRVPNDWPSLEAFVDWYVRAGKPILPPWNAQAIQTDDATAMCIFRHGQYQVEMYIIHPGYDIPVHSHPGMEVVTMTLGGGSVCGERRSPWGTSGNYGKTSKIGDGEFHGGKPTSHGGGFMILSLERWFHGTPTSAAIRWEGKTAGPKHDELIRAHTV
jgi:hypothetical protein